jgi:hypothetical protein
MIKGSVRPKLTPSASIASSVFIQHTQYFTKLAFGVGELHWFRRMKNNNSSSHTKKTLSQSLICRSCELQKIGRGRGRGIILARNFIKHDHARR